MSTLAQTPPQEGPAPRLAISYAAIKRGALWLLGASSGIALVEPSPYEIVFLLVLFVFIALIAASGSDASLKRRPS